MNLYYWKNISRFNQSLILANLIKVGFNFSLKELPRAINTSTLSGAGVMRLFNKVGETVNKITYKMDENDSVR